MNNNNIIIIIDLYIQDKLYLKNIQTKYEWIPINFFKYDKDTQEKTWQPALMNTLKCPDSSGNSNFWDCTTLIRCVWHQLFHLLFFLTEFKHLFLYFWIGWWFSHYIFHITLHITKYGYIYSQILDIYECWFLPFIDINIHNLYIYVHKMWYFMWNN